MTDRGAPMNGLQRLITEGARLNEQRAITAEERYGELLRWRAIEMRKWLLDEDWAAFGLTAEDARPAYSHPDDAWAAVLLSADNVWLGKLVFVFNHAGLHAELVGPAFPATPPRVTFKRLAAVENHQRLCRWLAEELQQWAERVSFAHV